MGCTSSRAVEAEGLPAPVAVQPGRIDTTTSYKSSNNAKHGSLIISSPSKGLQSPSRKGGGSMIIGALAALAGAGGEDDGHSAASTSNAKKRGSLTVSIAHGPHFGHHAHPHQKALPELPSAVTLAAAFNDVAYFKSIFALIEAKAAREARATAERHSAAAATGGGATAIADGPKSLHSHSHTVAGFPPTSSQAHHQQQPQLQQQQPLVDSHTGSSDHMPVLHAQHPRLREIAREGGFGAPHAPPALPPPPPAAAAAAEAAAAATGGSSGAGATSSSASAAAAAPPLAHGHSPLLKQEAAGSSAVDSVSLAAAPDASAQATPPLHHHQRHQQHPPLPHSHGLRLNLANTRRGSLPGSLSGGVTGDVSGDGIATPAFAAVGSTTSGLVGGLQLYTPNPARDRERRQQGLGDIVPVPGPGVASPEPASSGATAAVAAGTSGASSSSADSSAASHSSGGIEDAAAKPEIVHNARDASPYGSGASSSHHPPSSTVHCGSKPAGHPSSSAPSFASSSVSGSGGAIASGSGSTISVRSLACYVDKRVHGDDVLQIAAAAGSADVVRLFLEGGALKALKYISQYSFYKRAFIND